MIPDRRPEEGPRTASQDCLEALREFFAGRPRILEWGIAPARPTPNAERLRAWVDKGHHGGMEYMAARLQERVDPQSFHAWAESAVVFAFPYARPLGDAGSEGGGADGRGGESRYRIAAYAGATDYHDEARMLLREAEAFLKERTGRADLRFYGFADTAPVFERDLASEAGLGWRGKNCCTLNRDHGSAFHLSGFFLDTELPCSPPLEDFCGGCTRCLDQCPTGAFLGPGQLDANKCISYWTIEAKSELPQDLTEKFGGWIFGCDICQEVCPWNHKSMQAARKERGSLRDQGGISEARIFPESGVAWLKLLRKGGGFQSRFKRSPLTRAGRKSLVRNVAVAAANLGDLSLLEPLLEMLPEENDPAVRLEIEKAVARLRRLIP